METSRGCSSSPWPTGVAFTINVASATARFALVSTRAPSGKRRARASALVAFRATIETVAPVHASTAASMAAAAPPAPRSTTRAPDGSAPRSARAAVSNPPTSVLSPWSRPASNQKVFTAPTRAATSVRSSQRSYTENLCGMVTFPAAETFLRSRSKGRRSDLLTSSASYSRGIFAARSAAFWKVGEREWLTGFPSSTRRPGYSITPGVLLTGESVKELLELLLQHVRGVPVGLEIATVGITYSLVRGARCVLVDHVRLAATAHLLHRLEVPGGHDENEIGLGDYRGGELSRTMPSEVKLALHADEQRLVGGRGVVPRVRAGARDVEILDAPSLGDFARKRFRERASTCVAAAHEENVHVKHRRRGPERFPSASRRISPRAVSPSAIGPCNRHPWSAAII